MKFLNALLTAFIALYSRTIRTRLRMLPVLLLSGAAAAQAPGEKRAAPVNAPEALGALTNDLVYTPIAPCRIVNTQLSAAGLVTAGSTRSFLAVNASNFTSQGGSATNCGTPGLAATGVMLHVTAGTPTLAGNAIVYAFGTTQPTTTSVQYSAGAIVSSTVLAQIPNPQAASDFTLFTSATANFTVDIVGYFAPPVATALQCVETANTITNNIPAGGTANASAPACATGYTQTATNCESSDFLVPFVFFKNGTCSARNNSTNVQEIRASRTCCRVPGR